jgi:hypothetical protein
MNYCISGTTGRHLPCVVHKRSILRWLLLMPSIYATYSGSKLVTRWFYKSEIKGDDT